MDNPLIGIITQFQRQNILVIGDLILDRYLHCSVERISPEAPVPIAHVLYEKNVLGGAANTASNIAALGSHVEVVGRIGSDLTGSLVKDMLATQGVSTPSLITNGAVPTSVKTRIVCDDHQMIRFDQESAQPLAKKQTDDIIAYLSQAIPSFGVIVLSDYAKGVLTRPLVSAVISLAKRTGAVVLSDPTPHTFKTFRGSYAIKPNRKEAEQIAGERIKDDYSNLDRVGAKIKKALDTEVLIITLGKDGISIFENDKDVTIIPTKAQSVFDVSGAGDSTIAAIACSLASGADMSHAVEIGNYCAGIVVGKPGTAVCTQDELITRISNE